MKNVFHLIDEALVGKKFACHEGRTPDYVVTGRVEPDADGNILVPINYVNYQTGFYDPNKRSKKALERMAQDTLKTHDVNSQMQEAHLREDVLGEKNQRYPTSPSADITRIGFIVPVD